MNKVILVGRTGRDAELRFTESGKPVANFSVATSESWKDKSGEKKEETTWHNVVVWGPVAEVCGKYVKKGNQILVEGKIQTRQWMDKNQVTQYKTEVIAENVKFLSGKSQEPGVEF